MTGVANGELWAGRSVVVTGGSGFLGGPTVKLLEQLGANVRIIRSREHDLRDLESAKSALARADVAFHLAGTVGGIGFAHRYPGVLAYDNLAMASTVFEAARQVGVGKLVAVGSVCSYPQEIRVPFREDDLWEGYPESTNAPYGLAKKMLLVLSSAFRDQYGFNSCCPVLANLYGPGDNYDPEDSHVIAAMIRKFSEANDASAPVVELWGTGTPSREFLYIDDAARALVLAGERLNSSEPVNIGSGTETPIRELAETIAELVGYDGEVRWDRSKPDGQPRRQLDVSRAKTLLDFAAEVPLRAGLSRTIEAFRRQPVHAVNQGAT